MLHRSRAVRICSAGMNPATLTLCPLLYPAVRSCCQRGGAYAMCWLAPASCRDTILATSSSSTKKPACATKPAVRQKIYGAYLIIALLMVTEPAAPTNWMPSPTAFWRLKAEHVNSVSSPATNTLLAVQHFHSEAAEPSE
jgi:hypothetical protein